ncbi:MAG TPA: DUF4214 domain-containing protein [Pyrinomonadaceae bacterium]|jgi:hypothetical protein|nr:DUF4214 domain-containing protein [Pyrinomonadaceae bacterium]
MKVAKRNILNLKTNTRASKRNLLRWSLCAAALAACLSFMHGSLFSPEPAHALNGAISKTVVINEVYGGGGNAGATFINDFVELLNIGKSPVDVSGWSLQYQPNGTTTWAAGPLCSSTTAGTCVIQPGRFYLFALGSGGAVGAALPASDAPALATNIAAAQGKLALVNSQTALPTNTGSNCTGLPVTGTPAVIDEVGYGTSTNACFEGTTNAPGTNSTTSSTRATSTDTDQNGTDFTATSPPTPQNSASTPITPTAAPATVSGQITTPDGQPLAGTVVQLSGGTSDRTITDAQGHYQFENVNTDNFYTLRPQRANFSFSPSERSFSLNANKSDAVFTASANANATANPLDTDLFFVRQQYLDFLGREPDNSGLKYWANELDKCGDDAGCLNQRRVGIAAAFFMESESQLTGSYIYRLYKGGLGREVSYAEFSADRPEVVGGDNLEARRAAFAEQFVQREEFREKYSQASGAESFVDDLLANIRQASGADLSSQRAALIGKYKSVSEMNQSRALVVREAIDSGAFQGAEYNPAFVTMEYFGYLRRDAEDGGYRFWLNVMNNQEPGNYRGMVCSFITSKEYQERFSSYAAHSNRECSQ